MTLPTSANPPHRGHSPRGKEDNSHLPTILCLHGAGTNGTVFRLQSRRIIQALQHAFRFVFVDAPFEALPGPGVIPTFEQLRPYFRWHCDENAVGEFNIDLADVAREREQVRSLLTAHLTRENGVEKEEEELQEEEAAAQRSGGGHSDGHNRGPGVVGVMAFSQGTRVATGLCLDPELGRDIHFAILIAGTFPALHLSSTAASCSAAIGSEVIANATDGVLRGDSSLATGDRPDATKLVYGRTLRDGSSESDSSSVSSFVPDEPTTSSSTPLSSVTPALCAPRQINIPSVHIQGTFDPWAPESARLLDEYYNDQLAVTIQFRGAHQVPTSPKDGSMIAKEVLAAWERSNGLTHRDYSGGGKRGCH
ncbi:uncharacterized protein PG998_002759 [Apiospora kogelbergensis]|uniref:uncharacterized protein n=1 Tax=Apiospora kogelbergensis TaxID=1337665 RepID=UPI00312D06C9